MTSSMQVPASADVSDLGRDDLGSVASLAPAGGDAGNGPVPSGLQESARAANLSESGVSVPFADEEAGFGPSPAAFAALSEEVLAVIAREKKDGKIVQAADDLKDLFERMGLVTRMQIAPQQVGFDPANRHGEGGNAAAVHALLEMVATSGWSWAACSHALCVQVLPNDRTVEDYNRTMCYGTDLPPVERDTIRFGSLSAGHTNMGLRAILYGIKSQHEVLAENGRYSIEAVRRHDLKFGEAVEKGLKWMVLRSKVRVLFPEALNILQAPCTGSCVGNALA